MKAIAIADWQIEHVVGQGKELQMSYFVIFSYNGRETLYHFGARQAEAEKHFGELVDEMPPHASVVLYVGERRKSVGSGSCVGCPAIAQCADAGRCARLDNPGSRG